MKLFEFYHLVSAQWYICENIQPHCAKRLRAAGLPKIATCNSGTCWAFDKIIHHWNADLFILLRNKQYLSEFKFLVSVSLLLNIFKGNSYRTVATHMMWRPEAMTLCPRGRDFWLITSRVYARDNVFCVSVYVCLCLCVCVCVCLSVYLSVCLGNNFWMCWLRNFIFGMGVTSWPYLGQVWVSRSLGQGQGHLVENAHFATWTSV